MPFDSTPGPLDDMEWIRLAQYWAGECDPSESAAIEAWLDADPARRMAAYAMREVWEASGEAPAQGDPDAAWNTVRSRLHARRTTPGRLRAIGRADRFEHGWSARWVAGPLGGAIAATAIGALVLGYAVGIVGHRTHGRPGGREYVTAPGQSETIRLADGTEFTLAPASRLQLAADYGTPRRDVALEGEATFVVAHDAQHPFAVRAGDVLATDIGTRFDVRRYADESAVRVVVAEGEVGVSGAAHDRPAQDGGIPKEQALRAGDMATIAGTAVAVRHGVDVDAYFGWTSGRLTFDEASLPAVATELARWYGVAIAVGDPTVRARHVSITLERQSLAAALDVVALAVGARVVREGATYTFVAASSTAANP